MSLKDKVVIIMGASSGMGAATANLLAQEGTKLTIAARRLDRLDEIKANNSGASILAMKADVTNIDDVKAVVDKTVETYGRVDVMWNNAGIMPVNELRNSARTEWDNLININIHGVLNGIDAVLPTMIKQGSGHIISTDSVAGLVTHAKFAVYAGTKAAIRSIMEGLRQEEGKNGIKSTTIYPGQVATELGNSINNKALRKQISSDIKQPSMTVLKPEEIAKTVSFIIDTPANMSINELVIRPTAEL
ncbi:SDR family oxidoreductase [Companilactobacillus halodurans]|uniref:SDR family oxidoreductase n=1 Tax=Companilactobacillus halodurans TaxID=2584183 RepID=A0A5P0ZY85_9LACO|nr:SDR family oxidoreductase [Companilactobacillus halodurans]MQS75528.1 SDR family oxidoreductase [Companilactobacillus halodurans]MQS97772.1 SDR family oxidoreductase [Companilactobacillus halodurans]